MSSLAFNPVPLPTQDNLVLGKDRRRFGPKETDPNEYKINPLWSDALQQQAAAVAAAPIAINSVGLTNQSASIPATDFSGSALAAGLYEVRVYLRVTQAGSVSSSILVTIAWTEGGGPQSETFGAALTTNTTDTKVTGPAKLIRVDASSPITYAVTYAANAAASMKYELYLILSRVAE